MFRTLLWTSMFRSLLCSGHSIFRTLLQTTMFRTLILMYQDTPMFRGHSYVQDTIMNFYVQDTIIDQVTNVNSSCSGKVLIGQFRGMFTIYPPPPLPSQWSKTEQKIHPWALQLKEHVYSHKPTQLQQASAQLQLAQPLSMGKSVQASPLGDTHLHIHTKDPCYEQTILSVLLIIPILGLKASQFRKNTFYHTARKQIGKLSMSTITHDNLQQVFLLSHKQQKIWKVLVRWAL